MEHVYLLQWNQVKAIGKRERGKEFPIRFYRLLLRASIKNTLISRKVPSELVKNIAPSNDLCFCPSAVVKRPPVKEKEVQIEGEAHVPPTGMSPGIRDLVSVEYLSARPLPSSSKMRVVPRAPCLPTVRTPKPRWPLRLRLLPPVGQTSFRRLWLREKRGPLGCTAHTAVQRVFCWRRHWDSS